MYQRSSGQETKDEILLLTFELYGVDGWAWKRRSKAFLQHYGINFTVQGHNLTLEKSIKMNHVHSRQCAAEITILTANKKSIQVIYLVSCFPETGLIITNQRHSTRLSLLSVKEQ